MKRKTIHFFEIREILSYLIFIIFLSFNQVYSHEVIAKASNFVDGKDDLSDFIWTLNADNQEKSSFSPDLVEGDTLVWRNIPSGSYRLSFDLHEENWSGVSYVVKKIEFDAVNYKFNFKLPKSILMCTIDFGDYKLPKWESKNPNSPIIMRVERILSNGSIDPLHIQWLWTSNIKGNLFTGRLEYPMNGMYRITAMNMEADGRTVDYLEGKLEINDQILKVGNATIILKSIDK
jgi:hypothetical protein